MNNDKACEVCGVEDAYSANHRLCFIHRIREYQLLELEHGPGAVIEEAVRAGRGGTTNEEPLSLIVGKTHPRADELFQAFQSGLRKIISSGLYRELMDKHRGKTEIPADYFQRLERYLPAQP